MGRGRSGISLFLGARVSGYLSLVFKICVRWETFKFGMFSENPVKKLTLQNRKNLLYFNQKARL
jgi:hypothetical protein